jgi:hypothetical protein
MEPLGCCGQSEEEVGTKHDGAGTLHSAAMRGGWVDDGQAGRQIDNYHLLPCEASSLAPPSPAIPFTEDRQASKW